MTTIRMLVGVSLVTVLAIPAVAAQPVDATRTRTWEAGQRLTITTDEAVYDAIVVDPSTATLEIVIHQAGRTPTVPERVTLLGATAGEQEGHGAMIFMRTIRRGLKMELGRGGTRDLTGVVTAIELGDIPPNRAIPPRRDRAA